MSHDQLGLPDTGLPRLVLVGAGHVHLAVLADRVRRPGAWPAAEVVVVEPEAEILYSGGIPRVIAGERDLEAAAIPLAPLAAAAGARVMAGWATLVDRAARVVTTDDGAALPYDLLSLDVGGTPAAAAGGLAHVVGVKPFGLLLAAIARADDDPAVAAEGSVVVGAGGAGCEVAMALRRRWPNRPVRLVGSHGEPAPDRPASVRRALARALERARVDCHWGARVERVGEDHVTLAGGVRVPAGLVVLATGNRAPALLRTLGLPLDPKGALLVGRDLRCVDDPRVFAGGDGAAIAGAPQPMAGVRAVRHGTVLARNLAAAIAGRPLSAQVDPARGWGLLLQTGARTAVADWAGFGFESPLAHALKAAIDEGYVRGLNRLGGGPGEVRGAPPSA